MKSGFPDLAAIEKDEIYRGDQVIPLNQFGIGGIEWAEIKKKFALPTQYLRTCTLREGTIITMCIYQTMCLGVVAFLMVMLILFPTQTEYWWKEKFRNDLDYYYQDENIEMINQLYPLWRPFTYAIIGAHMAFFFAGWLVVFALAKRNSHPCWYMPWILISCFLSTVHWIMCGVMILVTFIFAFYRDISVTWDLVPICCTIVYGVGWSYSSAVVIAQYKRRCIVRYWREKQHLMGTDTYPPEIQEYLYRYAKSH